MKNTLRKISTWYYNRKYGRPQLWPKEVFIKVYGTDPIAYIAEKEHLDVMRAEIQYICDFFGLPGIKATLPGRLLFEYEDPTSKMPMSYMTIFRGLLNAHKRREAIFELMVISRDLDFLQALKTKHTEEEFKAFEEWLTH